jgi:hypothetical protein
MHERTRYYIQFLTQFLSRKNNHGKFLKMIIDVATLALGSRPRQRLAKVRVKSEAQESHFMFSGVWESEGMNPHTPK